MLRQQYFQTVTLNSCRQNGTPKSQIHNEFCSHDPLHTHIKTSADTENRFAKCGHVRTFPCHLMAVYAIYLSCYSVCALLESVCGEKNVCRQMRQVKVPKQSVDHVGMW